MKQYIKFLKFLWVILIVPSLYGMEVNPNLKYGLTRNMIKEDIKFIESMEVKAVKESSGISEINSLEDAENLVREIFQTIDKIKNYNYVDGINFLFWKNKAYLNGLIPTGYDKFWLNKRKKSYRVIQLYEILGYKNKRDEIEAAGTIVNNFLLLRKAQTYSKIREFWNKIRMQKDHQIDFTFKEYVRKFNKWKYKDPNFITYLNAAVDYIRALNTFNIDTTNLEFCDDGLFKSFYEVENQTKDLMKGYLEAFGKYIKELNENDGNRFLEDLVMIDNLQRPISYLVEARNLWTKKKYNLYTHTERMTQYLRKRDGILSELFCAVSYFDPCTDSDPQIDHCEQIFAKTTAEELIRKRKNSDESDITTEKHYRPNAIIISGYPYGSRNLDVRQARENSDLVNHSVWLYQLSPESSQRN